MRRSRIGAALALSLIAARAIAQTASPNLSDQQYLASDPTFEARVLQSLLSTCSAIANEAVTGQSGTMPTALHLKRVAQCNALLLPSNITSTKPLMAELVATNATVVSDATQAGTVPLTSTNAAAQASKVLDADIGNAISANFDTLLAQP